jgi:hypothetical protein
MSMAMPCPHCGGEAVCDTVDNGVGEQQGGPYVCVACGWVEQPPKFEDIGDEVEF